MKTFNLSSALVSLVMSLLLLITHSACLGCPTKKCEYMWGMYDGRMTYHLNETRSYGDPINQSATITVVSNAIISVDGPDPALGGYEYDLGFAIDMSYLGALDDYYQSLLSDCKYEGLDVNETDAGHSFTATDESGLLTITVTHDGTSLTYVSDREPYIDPPFLPKNYDYYEESITVSESGVSVSRTHHWWPDSLASRGDRTLTTQISLHPCLYRLHWVAPPGEVFALEWEETPTDDSTYTPYPNSTDFPEGYNWQNNPMYAAAHLTPAQALALGLNIENNGTYNSPSSGNTSIYSKNGTLSQIQIPGWGGFGSGAASSIKNDVGYGIRAGSAYVPPKGLPHSEVVVGNGRVQHSNWRHVSQMVAETIPGYGVRIIPKKMHFNLHNDVCQMCEFGREITSQYEYRIPLGSSMITGPAGQGGAAGQFVLHPFMDGASKGTAAENGVDADCCLNQNHRFYEKSGLVGAADMYATAYRTIAGGAEVRTITTPYGVACVTNNGNQTIIAVRRTGESAQLVKWTITRSTGTLSIVRTGLNPSTVTYNFDTDTQIFTSPDKQVTTVFSGGGGTLSEMVTVKNGANQTASVTQYDYTTINNILLPAQITADPNGAALVTTMSYYPDGRFQQAVGPSGKWIRYAYSGDLIESVTTGVGNADPNSLGVNWNITMFDYTWRSEDQVTNDFSPRTITVIQGGVNVLKQYRIVYTNKVVTIDCPNADNAYTSPNNLVTTTWPCTEGAVWTLGKPRKIEYPNGIREVYTYDMVDPNAVVVTVMRGVPDPNNVVGVTSGTRIVKVMRPNGTEMSSTTYDLDTETVIDKQINGNFDADDHAGFTFGMDGLTNFTTFSCCGPETVAYPDGTVRTFGYDSRKRVSTETTVRGNDSTSYVFGYDADDNVLSIQRSETGGGNPFTITDYQAQYDFAGRVTSESNQDGQTTNYSYSLLNGQSVVTATYPNGATKTVKYYKDNTPQAITGTAVAPHYLEGGVENISGANYLYRKVYAADGSGAPTGMWLQTHADGMGRRFRTSLASGVRVSYGYNAQGQLTYLKPDYMAGTVVSYNQKGEVDYVGRDFYGDGLMHAAGTNRVTHTTTVVENGYIVQRTYVCKGLNVSTETLMSEVFSAPDGRKVIRKIYNNGNPIVYQTLSGYDPVAKTTTVTNLLPDSSSEVTVSCMNNPVSKSVYSAAGQLLNQKTYTADHGRIKTVTDSLTGTTTYNYFNNGRLQSVVTPSPQQTTTYTYNEMGQVAKVYLPDNSIVTNEYNLNGNPSKISGSQRYDTGFGYDIYGRCTSMTNWGSAGIEVTKYSYDPVDGQLSTMLYPDGTGFTNTVNYTTRTITRGDGAGITRTVTLYLDGSVQQISFATNNDANPLVLVYGYDRLRRVASINQSGDGTTGFVYDDLGTVLWETNSIGSVIYSPKNANGLIDTKTVYGPAGNTLLQLSMGYGDLLRLQSVTDGTMAGVENFADTSLTKNSDITQNSVLRARQTRIMDNLGRLASIATVGNAVTVDSHTYGFTGLNQRSSDTRADGSRWDYYYDAMGQLTNALAHRSGNNLSLDGRPSYTYDGIGNPIKRLDNTISGLYGSGVGLTDTYDANNRLITKSLTPTLLISGSAAQNAIVTLSNTPASRNGEEYQFAQNINYAANANQTVCYPIVGTVSTTNSEVGATNTVCVFVPPSATATFTYDNNGNLTSDDRWTYTWDKRNQLVGMLSNPDTSNTQFSVTFAYDALGRRKSRTTSTLSGGNWTVNDNRLFVYDNWDLVAELNATNNATLRTYVWGPNHKLLWATDATYGTYVPTYDGNGNVTRLLNSANSAVLASYEYGPFGNLRRFSGNLALVNPIRFSSQYQDPSGLIYYGLRYYSPSLGRWINRDPIGVEGGVNLYGFVGNDPINNIDPLGLATFPEGFIGPMQPGDFLIGGGGNYLMLVGPDGHLYPIDGGITDLSMDIYDLFNAARSIPRSLKDLAQPTVCWAKKKLLEKTAEELKKARNYFKNRKDEARKAWEQKTGQKWPTDANGNPWPAEHTPSLKSGGDPMAVTPRNPDLPDPHSIPGPDGLTDYQRWGALGTPAREANR